MCFSRCSASSVSSVPFVKITVFTGEASAKRSVSSGVRNGSPPWRITVPPGGIARISSSSISTSSSFSEPLPFVGLPKCEQYEQRRLHASVMWICRTFAGSSASVNSSSSSCSGAPSGSKLHSMRIGAYWQRRPLITSSTGVST